MELQVLQVLHVKGSLIIIALGFSWSLRCLCFCFPGVLRIEAVELEGSGRQQIFGALRNGPMQRPRRFCSTSLRNPPR